MIVKIIKVDYDSRTADVCNASSYADSRYSKTRFSVKWDIPGFFPKINHSYRALPEHNWVKVRGNTHLMHGTIHNTTSMEDRLYESRTKKRG